MDIFEEELEEIHEETVECAVFDSLPLKSKKIYWAQYDKFISWCLERNVSEYTENVLLEYFNEESKKMRSSTLWVHYSMLKATLAINKSIDISKYRILIDFLKRKNDGYQPKKSKIFEKEELEAFFNKAPNSQYLFMKVVAIMGIAGACRRYELANMTIDNIQDTGSAIIVTIPDTGSGKERSFTIKDNGNMRYLQILRKYMDLRPYCDHRRLFVNYSGGRCTRQPVGVNKFGRIPSEIASYLKLPDATDYTGDSFRRTSATLLVNAGFNNTSPRHLSGWKSEGYGENSIEAKLEIARKVLGLKWGKEAENSRTSEIAACSSKTPKPQTFSVDRREPSTRSAPDFSKNWPARTQQSSANINLTDSSSGRNNKGVRKHTFKNDENSAHRMWEQSEVEKDLGKTYSFSDASNMDSETHEKSVTAVRLPSEIISSQNISLDELKNASNTDAYQSSPNFGIENAVHSTAAYFTMPAGCVETILPHSIRSISAGTEIESIGRHISENSVHGKWEQNESDKGDDDSNSLSDVTNMNLSVILPHELSSSKSISTQNIDKDDSNQQRTYVKAACSVLKTINTSDADQCTSNNETDNAFVRKAATETILTDNIRDVEMVLIRLQAEKLLLELDKLKLQRDKMKAEKRNIHLRNSVLSLQKQLISIEFSDKAQTGSITILKTGSNLNISSSPTDVVDTKSKIDSCVPSVLVQNEVVAEENSDSDIEVAYVSINQLGGRHSDISNSDKSVAENFPNIPTIKTVKQEKKTKQVPSVSVTDNFSSGIKKMTSQKMYPSKSVLSDDRAPRQVTSSEEDLVTEFSPRCYSDTSQELGSNSQEVPVTYDQDPMRVNELEELSEPENEIGTNVTSARDRSREKDIQKLSPSYQHDLTTFTKSINLHENGSSSGANNVTSKKRKRETDVNSTNKDDETLLVHSNIKTEFPFIEVREPNFVLKKEVDSDFDSVEVGGDSLADIGEIGDTQHLDKMERIRKSYVDSWSENILQSSSKRILYDTDDANVNKKVKHKDTSL